MAEALTARPARIELSRLSLAALRWGQTNGKAPLLCVHGWLDNAASYNVLGPALARGREVTSIDLPGHGYSDHRPPGYPYHLLDYIQDLTDWVDRQPGPVHLIGHSLGGIIAALTAATRPENLRSLIMIDSLGPYVARPEDFPARLGKGIARALADTRKTMPVYPTVEAAEQARVGGRLPLSPLAARHLVPRNLRPVEGGWSWRTDSRLRDSSLSALTEEQVLASLGAIEVPVLLLQADHGMLPSDERLRRRMGVLAQVTHEQVKGSHHCHLDGDVPAMTAAIDRFLAGLEV